MQLPQALKEKLNQTLGVLGDKSGISSVQSVGGGCIHIACKVQTAQAYYFLKWNHSAPADMFSSEADGLRLMAQTNTVLMPEVLACESAHGNCPSFLLQTWIGAQGRAYPSIDYRVFGAQLAKMHRVGSNQAYGLAQDNYLGEIKQLNGWDEDWVGFYQEKRLMRQIRLASQKHLVNSAEYTKVVRLIDKLGNYLSGIDRRPCLIHGDLWGGNVLADGSGGAALIDPAVNFADREAEIAYTQLFGGFPAEFYDGYRNEWPLQSGYNERRDLYNLYHVINHLNHFGGSYRQQTMSIVNKYL